LALDFSAVTPVTVIIYPGLQQQPTALDDTIGTDF
jgi:hypothetical protein